MFTGIKSLFDTLEHNVWSWSCMSAGTVIITFRELCIAKAHSLIYLHALGYPLVGVIISYPKHKLMTELGDADRMPTRTVVTHFSIAAWSQTA